MNAQPARSLEEVIAARMEARAGARGARARDRRAAPHTGRDDRGPARERTLPHPPAAPRRRARAAVRARSCASPRYSRAAAARPRGSRRISPITTSCWRCGRRRRRTRSGRRDNAALIGSALMFPPGQATRVAGRLPPERTLEVLERHRRLHVDDAGRHRVGGRRASRLPRVPAAGERLPHHRHLARGGPARRPAATTSK